MPSALGLCICSSLPVWRPLAISPVPLFSLLLEVPWYWRALATGTCECPPAGTSWTHHVCREAFLERAAGWEGRTQPHPAPQTHCKFHLSHPPCQRVPQMITFWGAKAGKGRNTHKGPLPASRSAPHPLMFETHGNHFNRSEGTWPQVTCLQIAGVLMSANYKLTACQAICPAGQAGPQLREGRCVGGGCWAWVLALRMGCEKRLCSNALDTFTGEETNHAFKEVQWRGRPAAESLAAKARMGPSRVAMVTASDWKGPLAGCEGQKAAP